MRKFSIFSCIEQEYHQEKQNCYFTYTPQSHSPQICTHREAAGFD